MAMDDVERARLFRDLPEFDGERDRRGGLIVRRRCKSHRGRGGGDEVRRRLRVAAGEERHVVAASDELLGQIDDALGATV
jgi:hypothetical protein